MGERQLRSSAWNQAAIFNGVIKVCVTCTVGSRDTCSLRIEDSRDGELFVACDYVDERSVRPCVDTGRGFVLRVTDTGRTAHLGVRFEDRDLAFDFVYELQEFVRRRDAVLDPFVLPSLTAGREQRGGTEEEEEFGDFQ